MAKQKSNKTSKNELDELILVTPKNRKFCIQRGRILHVYTKAGSSIKKSNIFDVRPRIGKGWNIGWANQTGLYTFKSEKEEDRESYADGFREVIDHLIKREELYINPNEPIIKYEIKK